MTAPELAVSDSGEVEGRALDASSAWRGLLRRPAAVVSILALLAFIALGLLAPLLAPFDPNVVDLSAVRAGPSAAHPLGGDTSGRDILSRLLFGAQTTLVNATIAVGVGLLVGAPTGIFAGYLGGAFDRVACWISDLLQSVPGMIVLLIVAAGSGNDLRIVMVAVGIIMAPGYFRMARSTTLSVRSEPYIDAARVAGLSTARIVGGHVLRVVAAPLVIATALTAGIAMGLEAGLQFLGVGGASTPSWGAMMNEGFQNVYGSPLMLLWPSAALGIAIAALATLGASIATVVEGHAVPLRRKRRLEHEPAEPATGMLAHIDGEAAARIERLRVEYVGSDGAPVRVVHGVSLDIAPGEVVGIVGESGSGKSQTVLSLLGLLPSGGTATADSMWVGDTRVDTMPDRERRRLLGRELGYVPQEPMANLDPSYTIGTQLIEPLRTVHGLAKAAARERVLAALDRVGIREPERVLRLYPHEISGGMAQRTLIAGAVAGTPKVLIADEPTTALDVTIQAEVLDLLRELQQETDMALVVVTHNFGVVADLCDRVIVMQRGRIVEVGAVEDVFAAPSHAYTASLIEAAQGFEHARIEEDAARERKAHHG